MNDPFGPARRWRSIVHRYYDRLVAEPGGIESPDAPPTPVTTPPVDDVVLDPVDDIGPAELGDDEPAPRAGPAPVVIGPGELDFGHDPADDDLIPRPIGRDDATR